LQRPCLENYLLFETLQILYHLTGILEFVSTTSAIEYALTVLNVENIVICGHSNCGGCNALWNENTLAKAPHTRKWLELAGPVKEQIEKHYGVEISDPLGKEWVTEQFNVVEQMKHIFSYPGVKEKYDNKTIRIPGWYYIIETGDIYNYNFKTKSSELIL